MHPKLDNLIGIKILEFSFHLSLKENIQICNDLSRRGGHENILKDLLENVYHALKGGDSVILDCDSMISLLDLLNLNGINEYMNQCMMIFQSNRVGFLDNVRIFNKFLESLRMPTIRESSQFISLVTSFNSRIRSFLTRPESHREGIFFSCIKFVLEFSDFGIACIGQFTDFLLKFPLIRIEDCCSLTRKFVYKLLLFQLNNSNASLGDSKFIDFLKSSSDLQVEFVLEMLEMNFGDYFLLKIYPNYFDSKYNLILEKFFKIFSSTSTIYSEGEEDFFISFEDEETEDECKIDNLNNLITEETLLFFKDSLLPIILKTFKSQGGMNCLQLKNFAVITGLLLGSGKVSWTDLSGTFGPNAASSYTNWEGRFAHCKIYVYWLRLPIIAGNTRSTLRTILNPDNYADLWLKSLYDLQCGGDQVIQFFNEYYGLLLEERIDCIKSKIIFYICYF